MSSSFRLLETMRVLPDGSVFLLERHMKRLSDSARQLSFQCDIERVRDAVMSRASTLVGPSWLRLTLSQDGDCTLDSGALDIRNPQRIKLATRRVNSGNPMLYHKTTSREIYEAAKREGDPNTEVLLINERNEITEITIANVAVLRGDRWITPETSCGLLGGIMRSELLATGQIAEGIIHADELAASQTIRCFNALRGIFDATLANTGGAQT
jgi:branched-subunit amino acid aminotransferase/4-amino-4-deoxychorismate lyase